MTREEYLKLRIRQSNNSRNFLIRWKSRVYDLLGNKCCHCGFSDIRALQIDHINGGGSNKERNRNSSYYKKVAKSIEKNEKEFQILCANCNWIKRWEKGENPNYYRKRHDAEFLNTLPEGDRQIVMDLNC